MPVRAPPGLRHRAMNVIQPVDIPLETGRVVSLGQRFCAMPELHARQATCAKDDLGWKAGFTEDDSGWGGTGSGGLLRLIHSLRF